MALVIHVSTSLCNFKYLHNILTTKTTSKEYQQTLLKIVKVI